MKKIAIVFIILVSICSIFLINQCVYAENSEVLDSETGSKLIEIKDKEKKEMQDYVEIYSSESYGFVAYILGKIRIYSIPLCFLGIAVSAIYQYVLGIRKLDVRDKGLALMISFVTLLVICQVLPLVFAVVVKGWRK